MPFLKNRSGMLRHALVLAPVALLAVGACEENRATTFAPVGNLGFNFGLLGVAAVGPYGFNLPPLPLLPGPAANGIMVTAPAGRIPAGQVTVPNFSAQSGNTVVVDVSWLRALTGSAVYQVWGRTTSGAGADVYTPLFGRLVEYRLRVLCVSGATTCASASTDTTFDIATTLPVLVIDSTVVAATAQGTYVGSDSTRELVVGARFTLSSTDPANTVNPAAQSDIIVSIEPAGKATTPSNYKILWRRIGINNGTLLNRDNNQTFASSVPMTFGNYGGADQFNLISPQDYRFLPTGSAAASVRGGELSINFTNLSRPPLGYYYRVVLQDSVSGAVGGNNQTLVDTLRSGFSAVSTLSRVSMYDADANDFLPGMGSASVQVITAPQNLFIKTASVRNCIAGSTEVGCLNSLVLPAAKPFGAILRVVLVLEPKLSNGATLGRGVTMSGDLSDPAKSSVPK